MPMNKSINIIGLEWVLIEQASETAVLRENVGSRLKWNVVTPLCNPVDRPIENRVSSPDVVVAHCRRL